MIEQGTEVVGQLAEMGELVLSLSIFAITFAVILSEKANRAVIAGLGASLMVISGVLTQNEAVHAIDFNTIGLLLGMMIVVAVTKNCGVFQFMAIWSSQRVKANPVGILIVLSLVTALFSAFLNNVTTVLLITPVILLVTRELKVGSYPYLFSAILASNIGGAATLIGDPPNIMIGSSAGLTFNDFLMHLAPITAVVFFATIIPICIIWWKDLKAEDHRKKRIMELNAGAAITDKVLLYKSLFVLVLAFAGFIFGPQLNVEPATVGMFAAGLLLFLDNFKYKAHKQDERVHSAIIEAEWVTLFFFVGLFIVVHGIEAVGVIDWMAVQLIDLTGGDKTLTVMSILWGSAILSALVDNIPFVAAMIPMVHSMGPVFGEGAALEPFWWSLALGACLGGNGSLLGSSANLVVAGLSDRAGHKISFLKFMAAGFPLMVWSMIICTIYIFWRYL